MSDRDTRRINNSVIPAFEDRVGINIETIKKSIEDINLAGYLTTTLAESTYQHIISYTTENVANKAVSISDLSTDIEYPSAKLLYDQLVLKLSTSIKGSVNGLAELDSNGFVKNTQLPSYVDDILEYSNILTFPTIGESGKIYISLDTNLTYRWSGTVYVIISQSLALGETSSTAYRGDRGKTAYDHTSLTNNPHSVTKAQVGLTNVTDNAQWYSGNHPTSTFDYGLPDYPTTLPASDVYSWAKANVKPSYIWSEIGSKPTSLSTIATNDLGNYGSFLIAADITGKQNNLSGTGFVKSTAGTISYDTSTYEPAFSKNTAFNKNFGTIVGTVLEGRTFGTAANSASTDFAPASGSSNYVQVSPASPQTGNIDMVGSATFASTIQATTAKLTDLTDGYIPYHISDASGLWNSYLHIVGNGVSCSNSSNGVYDFGDGNNSNINITNTWAGAYNAKAELKFDIGSLGTSAAISAVYTSYSGSPNGGFGADLVFLTKTALIPLAERMRILSNGNVGIGTTNPTNKLEMGDGSSTIYVALNGSAAGNTGGSALRLQNAGTDIGLVGNYSAINAGAYNGNFTIQAAPSSPILLNPNGGGVGVGYNDPGTAALAIQGNVGIGTTGPTSPWNKTLHLYDASNAAYTLQTSVNTFYMMSDASGYLGFVDYNGGAYTRRMVIDTNGNVGIGYSTGTEIDNNKLAVNGSGYFNTSLTVNGAASTYARLASFSSTGQLTPITDGINGQVLKTDGVGGYSFSNNITVISGTVAPITTPTKVGDIFVDTANKKLYIATGNSSSSDWTITN